MITGKIEEWEKVNKTGPLYMTLIKSKKKKERKKNDTHDNAFIVAL